MFKVYSTYENFPADKNLLKVRKLTNGKQNLMCYGATLVSVFTGWV